MTMTKAERLGKIHQEALAEFDRIQSVVREVRLQCLDARRFYSIPGAQWEGQLGEQFENKVRLEFNMVHLAVIRVVNEYRNNRITLDFTPKDGSSNDELADTCDGLYRADERDSNAQEAYDNAFEEAVGGGYGGARLRACYEDEYDEDNDKQRIKIEPIFDADSCVFFDLDAKRQDKADARKCFVLESMTHDSFEKEFGHSPSDWPKDINRYQFDWCTPDVVYIAHYYVVEDINKVRLTYRGLDDSEQTFLEDDVDEEKVAELEATGFRLVRRRKVKSRQIHKYILSGNGVEEDEGIIAGKCIPVVPNYGKRWYVDGVERCMGHVQLAMDAQRLMNSLMSWLTDMASRFDIEKPIFSPEQIQGHATMWANDNVERYPFLLANAMRDIEGNPIPGSQAPAAYTKSPQIPPAMGALVQIAQQALGDLLGNQQAGEQVQPNLSGKAVELIQNRLDMQVYIYMSNFAKFVQRMGEVWLSMMKDIVVEEKRKMKTVTEDGEISTVVMNEPGFDEKEGKEKLLNSLDDATFDVWVDVGPSSSSRRAATVRALTGMASITEDPTTKQALTIATLANLEGEGLGDLKDWARSQGVRMGVIKPTDEEQEAMAQEQANKQPDAQTQYLQAAAAEAASAAKQKDADTIVKLTQADLNVANKAKIEAETLGEHNSQQIASVQALQQIMQPNEPPKTE